MSFWNFIGEFALFNLICDLFSGKKNCGQGHYTGQRRSYMSEDNYHEDCFSDYSDFDDDCDNLFDDDDW